jgi:hypothetical protein
MLTACSIAAFSFSFSLKKKKIVLKNTKKSVFEIENKNFYGLIAQIHPKLWGSLHLAPKTIRTCNHHPILKKLVNCILESV